MDLVRINTRILRSLSRTLRIKAQRSVSALLVESICSRLSDGKYRSGKLESLFKLLTNLGMDLSHIQIQKVLSGDEVSTYLLLDLLNLLMEALQSDNQTDFTSFIKSHEKTVASEEEVGGGGGGGTTSGAEEVDRILEEARKKYGKIRSFSEKLVKEDISIIPKVAHPQQKNFSEVDNCSRPGRIMTKGFDNTAASLNTEKPEIGLSNPVVRNASTGMSSQSRSTLSQSSTTYGSKESSLSSPPHRERRKRKRKPEPVENDENQVNIRIPLEDASINVKVKTVDGKPLGDRRIHVRLLKEKSPLPSKRIVYGTKSVLYHHHRKNRPPVFSKPPPAPLLTEDQVLNKAVKQIKKRKLETDKMKEEEERETDRVRKEDVRLATQKYLRDLRTRNGRLKRLAAQIKE